MYVYVCVSRGYYLVLDPEHVKIKKNGAGVYDYDT